VYKYKARQVLWTKALDANAAQRECGPTNNNALWAPHSPTRAPRRAGTCRTAHAHTGYTLGTRHCAFSFPLARCSRTSVSFSSRCSHHAPSASISKRDHVEGQAAWVFWQETRQHKAQGSSRRRRGRAWTAPRPNGPESTARATGSSCGPASAAISSKTNAFQGEFSAKAIRGLMARRKGTDTPPPHGPPGSGAGCYPPHAVLTRPVAALILYIKSCGRKTLDANRLNDNRML
jgi:hypothetical protein